MLNQRSSPLFVNLPVSLLYYSYTYSKCVMFVCSWPPADLHTCNLQNSHVFACCSPPAHWDSVEFLSLRLSWRRSVEDHPWSKYESVDFWVMGLSLWNVQHGRPLNLTDLRCYTVVLFTWNLNQSSVLVLARVEQQVAVLACLEICGAQKPFCHIDSPVGMWWPKHMTNSYKVFDYGNQTFCKCPREAKLWCKCKHPVSTQNDQLYRTILKWHDLFITPISHWLEPIYT